MPTSTFRAPFLLALLLLPGMALAEAGDKGKGGRGAAHRLLAHDNRSEQFSLAETVRRVERATGGQILSAERVPFDGRDLNRIKVLDSTGRVRVITEDPRSRPTRADDGRDD